MMLHSFVIPVAPKSLQFGGKRLCVIGGHARFFKDKKATAYQDEIRYRVRDHLPKVPHGGPLCLALTFNLPAPKAMKRIGPAVKRPDLDNLIKGTQDALSDFWEDDSQIVRLFAQKFYAENQNVSIFVTISSAE